MIHLVDTNDKLSMILSAAVTVDTICSYTDLDGTTVTPGKAAFARSTAATHDLVAAPSGTAKRRVHTMFIRNRHATSAVDVTVQLDDGGSLFELHKVTLLAGEMLEYVEGLGFFTVQTTRRELYNRRVTTDYVNATTSFSDITGLTCLVSAGKHYRFLAHLFHFANATTSGPRFAINGPAMTALRLGAIITESGGVAAAVMNGNVGDVTALDTAVAATTDSTTTMVLSIFSGWFNPSASGTFAIRGASEVAVAAGLTVKAGSWLEVAETDN